MRGDRIKVLWPIIASTVGWSSKIWGDDNERIWVEDNPYYSDCVIGAGKVVGPF